MQLYVNVMGETPDGVWMYTDNTHQRAIRAYHIDCTTTQIHMPVAIYIAYYGVQKAANNHTMR